MSAMIAGSLELAVLIHHSIDILFTNIVTLDSEGHCQMYIIIKPPQKFLSKI